MDGGDHRPGRTLFYDDFSSGALDRSRWNVRTTGRVVNDEQQAYVDSPETLYVASDGPGGSALALHPRHRPGFETPEGQIFDFLSARIDTRERFSFRYGTAAARMRLPAGAGLWPAFWVHGAGRWPHSGEIDVMEYVGEPDWVSCAAHGPGYSGESALVNKWFFTADDATGWHTYSVDWGPDRIEFRVDHRIVYRVTRPMVAFFGDWVFDDPKHLILNVALGGTYPFKTNGVHAPYYGLPEDTATLIATGAARVLVDWVRVDAFDPAAGAT